MVGYTRWKLPPTLPIQRDYLLSISPPKNQKVHYCKYIQSAIGELDLRTGDVKEWACPPSLTSPHANRATNLTEIDSDANSLWCVSDQYYGSLFNFEPVSGIFTRWGPKRGSKGLRNPSAIDAGDTDVWFVEDDRALSRFNKTTGQVDTWTIPHILMRGLCSIAVDPKRRRVWVCARQDQAFGSWIAHLDTQEDVLVTYRPKMPAYPLCSDIIVDGGHVWFSSFHTRQIYRLHRDSGVAETFVAGPSSIPRFIGLDPDNRAWVSDKGTGGLIRCEPDQGCGHETFDYSHHRLPRTTKTLIPRSEQASPFRGRATATTYRVNKREYPCTTAYSGEDNAYDLRCMPTRGGLEIVIANAANIIGVFSV